MTPAKAAKGVPKLTAYTAQMGSSVIRGATVLNLTPFTDLIAFHTSAGHC